MPLFSKDGKELLFIHIPKCGGTSLEKIFRPELKMSLYHEGPGELRCSPQHFHASYLESLFDYRIPPSIAVVRNPFDRLVSEFMYQRQQGLIENIEFDQFVNNSLGEYWQNNYVHDNHIRPQVEFIASDTVIFRLEEAGIEAARNYITKFFAFTKKAKMPKENVSKKIDFAISPQTIDLINSFYQRDFEFLGYTEIRPGRKPKKLSSISYSSAPTFDSTESTIIRQKVLHDKSLIAEHDKARIAAELEHAEEHQKIAEKTISSIEQELEQNSLSEAEIANKLDDQLAKIKDLFINNITQLLKEISNQSKSTSALLETELTHLRSYMSNSGRTSEGIQKNIGQVLTSIARGFDSRSTGEAEYRAKLGVDLTLITDGLDGVGQKLGITANEIVTAIDASQTLVMDRLNSEYETLISVLGTTEKLAHSIDDINGEITSSTGAVKAAILASLENLRRGLTERLDLRTANLEQSISSLVQQLEELEKSHANSRQEELASSTGSLKAVILASLESLRRGLTEGLNLRTANLEQSISSLGQQLQELGNSQESSRKTVSRFADKMGSAAESQKTLLLASLDSICRGLTEGLEQNTSRLEQNTSRLEQSITNLGQQFAQLEVSQESSRLAGEREIVEQFRILTEEIRQKEILELRSEMKELASKLAASKSNELALNIKLENAAGLATSNREQTNALIHKLEDMERKEGELRKELLETVDRFHEEIAYRNTLHARTVALETEVAQLQQQNRALLESRSYRITRPLRTLSTTLKILRPRRLSAMNNEERLRLAPPASSTTSTEQNENTQRVLNIAIVVENLDRGGLEQVVLDHARYFSSHCHSLDVYVVGETGYTYEQALKYGINVFCIRNDDRNLKNYLGEKRYHYAFFHHSYGFLPAFRTATKTMVEVLHNEYSWQLDNEFFNTIRAKTIDFFIAVSDPVRQYSIANLNIAEDKIVAIANGLNIEGFIRPPIKVILKNRASTLMESPTFIMAANGQPQKNHVLVIRAFTRLLKKYPKAKLLLAGNFAVDSDVERAIYAELGKSSNPPSIELLGSLNRRQLSKYLATAHIALLPTKYEGFSVATLEYLFFGLPMILSNTGGAEYIARKYGSVIIDKNIARNPGEPVASEVKSLVQSMNRMIEQYASFTDKCETAAVSYLDYSVDAVCHEYLNLRD
jgi:glycosyltransferase involved in cell wall biosynthesis